MTRTTFLTLSSSIALAVGALALLAPATLLAGKGVAPLDATQVWTREVGVLLLATGLLGLLVRTHPDSPTMRAYLAVNALLQVAIFPIELVAYHQGVITTPSGVVPNSVLHAVLAAAFATYAARVSSSPDRDPRSAAPSTPPAPSPAPRTSR